jgi:hypothetical protein
MLQITNEHYVCFQAEFSKFKETAKKDLQRRSSNANNNPNGFGAPGSMDDDDDGALTVLIYIFF